MMIEESGPSLADSVKRALRHPSSSSNGTVATLRQLLTVTAMDERPKRPESTRRVQLKASARTVTRAVNPRIAAKVAVFQAPNDSNLPLLSGQDRLVLATEVFNIASKSLSEYLKKRDPASNEGKRSTHGAQHKEPLQPTSPNRKPRSPNKPKSISDESVKQNPEIGIARVGECAIIALSTLQGLKAVDTDSSSADNQLEQGLCILVGKLLAAGLQEAAIEGLWMLKSRISSSPGRSTRNETISKQKEQPNPTSLKNLLQLPTLPQNGPLLQLTVAFQSHAIRAIAQDGDYLTIFHVLGLLKLSNPSSPANMILLGHKNGDLSGEKAALHLRSLSQNILSLASSYSHAETISNIDESQVSSAASLLLQILALEVRCMWWKVSGHKCDEDQELWRPFARYLTTFVRRCSSLQLHEFDDIQDAFLQLKARLKQNGYSLSFGKHNSSFISTVIKTMGQLAYIAGRLEVATELCELSTACLENDDIVQRAIFLCRKALLKLESFQQASELLDIRPSSVILEAAKYLKAPLKASQREFDELLVESAKLKKTIMKHISNMTDLTRTAALEASAVSEFYSSALEYLISFVRFLTRYLSPSLLAIDQTCPDQLSPRVQKCEKIALAAVDSAIAFGKLVTAYTSWSDVESLLCDCFSLCQLLRRIDCNLEIETSIYTSTSARLLRISNLYWSVYLRRKELGNSTDTLLPLVERSVIILQACSHPEQISGFIATKLERQAYIYSEAGQESKALATYEAAIAAHIKAGVLDAVIKTTSSSHLSLLWRDPQNPAFSLGRVLACYIKNRIRNNLSHSDVIVYDNEELEPYIRAAILEQQTSILVGKVGPSTSTTLASQISSAITQTLSFFPEDQYPIRRARLILNTLRSISDNDSIFENDFSRFILSEARNCILCSDLYMDSELEPIWDSIRTSLQLSIAFYLRQLNVETLETVVETWIALVRSCKTWSAIEKRVEDPALLISQLRSIIDYLEVQGSWKLRITTTAVLNQLLAIQESRDFSTIVSSLASIGLQYCQLGYFSKAGYAISKAKSIIERHEILPFAQISWLLTSAEYHLGTGDHDKSLKDLSEAQNVFESSSTSIVGYSFQAKCMMERLGVNAACLISRVYFSMGKINEAAYFAKGAMRQSSRLWARLEKYVENKAEKIGSKRESPTDELTERIAAIDLSEDQNPNESFQFGGPIYWPYFTSHLSALLELSRVSDHNGLFQEAVYHGEQALTICNAIGAKSIATMLKFELACRLLRGGLEEKGFAQLDASADAVWVSDNPNEMVAMNMHMATVHIHKNEIDNAYNLLSASIQKLSELSNNLATCFDPFEDTLKSSETKAINENKSKTKPRETRTATANRRLRSQNDKKHETLVTRPKSRSTKRQVTLTEPEPSTVLMSSSRLHGDILRRQAMLLLHSHHFDDVAVLLDQAKQDAGSEHSKYADNVCMAEYMVASVIQNLSTHPVYCVLPESTIALPSILLNDRSLNEKTPSYKTRCAKTSRFTKPTSSIGSTNLSKAASGAEDGFLETLSTAKETLAKMSSSVTKYGSSKEGHETSSLQSRVSILSFATGSAHGAKPEPFIAASAIENGRNCAVLREHSSIISDKQLGYHVNHFQWPALSPKGLNFPAYSGGPSTFMEDYINILPENWDVISVTLCANRDEFIISKLRKDRTPFILRLPLKRGEDDMDEETFTFEEGKEELLDIIRLANESAHDAKAQVDRKAKKQWWANREGLDERMKTLLQNVEAIWFGGFRGIFSQKPGIDALLLKFVDQFYKILDKHLPSRRNTRGKAKVSYPTFDMWVMELFVNIGYLEDEACPEDAVMDLLYFVVDILQFHGERNAYDEIDFDMMVVETLDALRGYEEEEKHSERAQPNSRHTILILDKALHSFPWESLECLKGASVSRMPSLQSLRELLLRYHGQTMSIEDTPGYFVNRNSGSYILNPGGDLKSTEKIFEAPLSGLKGWTGIVRTEPSEEEFETALESKDIMLYFGHGSGAQYIRGRTIRKLDRCAVTFLMGCSSGSMTEAGEFESYGTPWNYMHAKAPALVATLWDVTDKDIDRFAKSVFEKWGLLPSGQEAELRDEEMEGTEPVGLDEAVSQSRDSCILRYLNGAAPVIYGIPVFLI
ncbi:hypothetical protein FQN57_006999 [Myotisia sp. PD_48]|nr:hypothetical protein FQN57_006999 [Myotisia sp. PD_48]